MELLLFLGLLAATATVLVFRADRRTRAVGAVCALVVIGGGLAWQPGGDPELDAAVPGRATDGGFVSSDACRACHPDAYHAWHRSFHRTMTQRATPASVLGSFDGVELEDRGFTTRLERRGDRACMTLHLGRSKQPVSDRPTRRSFTST